MSEDRQNTTLARLAENPPKIEGGKVALQPTEGGKARLRIELGDHQADLLAAFLAVPYPSGLKRLVAANPDLEAVIVERVPPGLDQAAHEMGLSYLDIHGHGRITQPGFVYFAPPSSSDRSPTRTRGPSPFAPKASRVLRSLLADHETERRLSDLARETALNPGNVHRVLNRLMDDGYVEREKDAYLVVDPGALLNAWAENGSPAREQTSIPVKGDLRSAAEGLLERFHGHAVISGELAAELLAPHLPAASAVIHCLNAKEWARIDLEEIEVFRAPGRILLDLPDPGVAQFGSQVSELPLVGAAQLYVDLYREPTRGRQAAEEVRRQLLDF